MARVPMPSPDQLPAGPHRDLLHAVHVLHEEAGWPGLQKTSTAIKARDDLNDTISHEGISKILRGEVVPTQWLKLEALVRQYLTWSIVRSKDIDQEVLRVHSLWQRAVTTLAPGPGDSASAGPSRHSSPEHLAWIINELFAEGHDDRAHEMFAQAAERGPSESVPLVAALMATHPDDAMRSLYFLGVEAARGFDTLADLLTEVYRVPPETWRGRDSVDAVMQAVVVHGGLFDNIVQVLEFLDDRSDRVGFEGLLRAAARKLDPSNAADFLIAMKRSPRADALVSAFLSALVAHMDEPLVRRMLDQLDSHPELRGETAKLAVLAFRRQRHGVE
ncbi:hypothetical protein [Kitasatospora sp. NPDC056184]|uniref:hypothetical protein n=1 Tax=Kitasatospora sp. NPDC056184 TaxID=3345738 RepID=UPI0035DE28EE